MHFTLVMMSIFHSFINKLNKWNECICTNCQSVICLLTVVVVVVVLGLWSFAKYILEQLGKH